MDMAVDQPKLQSLFKSFTSSTASQTTALQELTLTTESTNAAIQESVIIQRGLLSSYNSMFKFMKDQAVDTARGKLYDSKPGVITGKVGNEKVTVNTQPKNNNGESGGLLSGLGGLLGGFSLGGVIPRLLIAGLVGDIAGSLVEQAGKSVTDYLGLDNKNVAGVVDNAATAGTIASIFGLKAGLSVFAGSLIGGAINSFLSDEQKTQELTNIFGISIQVEDVITAGSIALGFGITSLLKKGIFKLFSGVGALVSKVIPNIFKGGVPNPSGTSPTLPKPTGPAANTNNAPPKPTGPAANTNNAPPKPTGPAGRGAPTLPMDKSGMFLSEGALAKAGKNATGEAAEAATKAAAAKAATKAAAAAAAKTALKAVPGLGLLAAGGFAAQRAYGGDYLGAGIEALSGVASIIPVIGTAASIALSGVNIARDISSSKEALNTNQTKQMLNNNYEIDESSMYGVNNPTSPINSNAQVTVRNGRGYPVANSAPIIIAAPDNSTVVGGSSVVNNNSTTIVNNSINPAAALDSSMYLNW